MSPRKSVAALLLCILICLAAGGIGGMATADNVGDWYQTINKPSWNPPGWVFGPVWTTLYLMMAVSAWMIWKVPDSEKSGKKAALTLFAIQLLLNALWSFVFFEWHALGWAVIEISALWLAILTTMIAFLRIKKIAAWLLAPYLAWVSFASFLTCTIWTMNR